LKSNRMAARSRCETDLSMQARPIFPRCC